MTKDKTCCFTGHRPEKLPWGFNESDPRCIDLKERIRLEVERAYDEGYRHFITGMARGCDQYFTEIVMELRTQRGDVTVEAAIPCEGQAAGWAASHRRRYEELVALCDFESVVQHQYTKGCMQRRNRYMVNRSTRLIAVYDGMPGGTRYTVQYAMEQGLDVCLISFEYE